MKLEFAIMIEGEGEMGTGEQDLIVGGRCLLHPCGAT
jgi:hypothetical protein